MNIRFFAITGIASCLAWSSLFGQSDPADTKAKLAKWVETRQLISEEVNDWKEDKVLLTTTRDMLKDQAAKLEADVANLKAEESTGDQERVALTTQRSELQIADIALAEQIAIMESEVLELVKVFPEPLKTKLNSLIVQIPDDPAKTELTLSTRLTHVLGILNLAEKFNSTANFVGETREVGGQKIQVKTLYWGLSFALYVDSQGRTAGFGMPGSDGWVWTENKAIAPEAKRFMDMYEGTTDVIEFVELPVTIQ